MPLHIFEERYKEMVGDAIRDKGQRLGIEIWYTHIDGHLSVILDLRVHQSTQTIHTQVPLTALLCNQTGDTTRTITALLHLRPIGIKVAIINIRVGMLGWLDYQSLIKTNARPAVR